MEHPPGYGDGTWERIRIDDVTSAEAMANWYDGKDKGQHLQVSTVVHF